jgi:integrase
MPRRRKSRIYWRNGWAWGDFRDFADVGGRQESLRTQDPDTANALANERLAELFEARKFRNVTGLKANATLADYARRHLEEKAAHEDVTDGWLTALERYLDEACEYFGSERPLTMIRVSDVKRWIAHLKKQGLSGGTIHHYLNAVSNLYRGAGDAEVVPAGYNPVAALSRKPKHKRSEARFYEHHWAALLLEGARLYKPQGQRLPFMFPLVATFLLTGGRRSEVLGLEVEDVSFDRKTVWFRSNTVRRLKTEKSNRVVPLWPQLKDILGEYIATRPPSRLLFPVFPNGTEQMVTDLRKAFNALGSFIKYERTSNLAPPKIHAQAFRNTYCTVRLQTLDNGAPVSVYTVAREMGHGSTSMVERIYGHLGEVRHRADIVEYRVEDFRDELKGRLTALGM